MRTTTADGNGRITLGTEYIHKYGKRFEIILNPNNIVLVPISKNCTTKSKKTKLEMAIKEDMEWALNEK